MLRHCLALLAGAYALQFFASLPPNRLLAPAFALALAALAVRRVRIAAFCLLGFCIAWEAATGVLDDRLDAGSAGETLTLSGRVADFPERRGALLRFVLQTREPPELPRRIRLSWYDAERTPRVGETWTLTVRLRRPRGFANPTGFDYEQWLFRQRIGATGYVLAHPHNRRHEDAPVPLHARLRQHVADRILVVTGDDDASAVLQALVVGARHRITAAQWDRYAASGTSHLMAISGLHIGLAAGGAWLIGWLLIAPFCRWRNLRDIAALVALCAAAAYASVSGFAVPAQRAVIMALVVIGAGLLRRQLPALRVLALAMIAVFLGDPLSIMAPGFKLSFAAVAILLWSARQRATDRVFAYRGGDRLAAEIAFRLPPLQLTLLLGLLPLTVLSFGHVAWLAPVVNLLILPLFNFVIVPGALLGALLDGPLAPAGDLLLRVSWYAVRSALALVAAFADWPAARVHVATSAGLVAVAVLLAMLWAVLPPGWPGRKVALIAAAASMLLRPVAPPAACVEITALDVGQGLAMVLRTRTRVLVFDTGPAFRNGGDTGQLVLVPYLQAAGIDRVDLLMVSHADNDHAGGVASLLAAVPVERIMTGGFIERIARTQWRCRRGLAWYWDGVRFSVMHPGGTDTGRSASDNDESCVLEIATGRHRALMTGDIERAAETRLLESGSLSEVDLVVVPHHGSLTSSSEPFVRRLDADVALVSAGFDNRWNLPRAEVVERWERTGARVFNTAVSGALRTRMCGDTGLGTVSAHRADARRYWHEPEP